MRNFQAKGSEAISPHFGKRPSADLPKRNSQTLGFPPDTKITLRNLSKTTAHTMNVIEAIKGPPAKFPANPTLPTSPSGHGILGTGFRSGVLNPGKSVTITLSKTGTYLIGCAFHYSEGMRDVFVVEKGSKPGRRRLPRRVSLASLVVGCDIAVCEAMPDENCAGYGALIGTNARGCCAKLKQSAAGDAARVSAAAM